MSFHSHVNSQVNLSYAFLYARYTGLNPVSTYAVKQSVSMLRTILKKLVRLHRCTNLGRNYTRPKCNHEIINSSHDGIGGGNGLQNRRKCIDAFCRQLKVIIYFYLIPIRHILAYSLLERFQGSQELISTRLEESIDFNFLFVNTDAETVNALPDYREHVNLKCKQTVKVLNLEREREREKERERSTHTHTQHCRYV